VIHESSEDSIAERLILQVCKREGSSDVNDPVPLERNLQTMMEQMPPPRYIDRRFDMQLATPNLQVPTTLQDTSDDEAFY
jgi:hypothetical protein